MEQDETIDPDYVTVVSPEFFEELAASLDEPTEMSKALAEAARRKREIIRNV
jgi:uncharacterized protein (DUF1778 family)